jgi:hypothetical protein
MFLTEEQLKSIEEMSALFFSCEAIADNLEIEYIEFSMLIDLKQGPAYRAYRKGRLQTEIDLRAAIKMAAMNGSSPAQNLMVQFFKDSQL